MRSSHTQTIINRPNIYLINDGLNQVKLSLKLPPIYKNHTHLKKNNVLVILNFLSKKGGGVKNWHVQVGCLCKGKGLRP